MSEIRICSSDEGKSGFTSKIDHLKFYNDLIKKSEKILLHNRNDFFLYLNGKNVNLIFTDKNLETELTGAFQHIKSEKVHDPDLSIYCLRSGNDLKKEVFIPSMERLAGKDRDIPYFEKDGIIISLWRDSGSLSVLNRKEKKAVFINSDPGNLAYYEKASPFRNIFQWWFDTKSSSMLHSGAIGVNGSGFLLSGRGGTGKSATTLTCAMNGIEYLGDDYVIVSRNGDYGISSIYNTAKLTDFSLGLFPDLKESITNKCFSNEEKGLLFMGPGTGTKISSGVKLNGIIVPEIIENEDPSFKRISPAEGFRALAPSTVFQHSGKRDNLLKFIGGLTKNTPCYKLFLNRDPRKLLKEIKKIING